MTVGGETGADMIFIALGDRQTTGKQQVPVPTGQIQIQIKLEQGQAEATTTCRCGLLT